MSNIVRSIRRKMIFNSPGFKKAVRSVPRLGKRDGYTKRFVRAVENELARQKNQQAQAQNNDSSTVPTTPAPQEVSF